MKTTKYIAVLSLLFFCGLYSSALSESEPIDSKPKGYEAEVTPTSPYIKSLKLPQKFCFNIWKEVETEFRFDPGDKLYVLRIDSKVYTLGQHIFKSSSTGWEKLEFPVPASDVGNYAIIRFEVHDCANVTKPKVYLRKYKAQNRTIKFIIMIIIGLGSIIGITGIGTLRRRFS